MAKITAAIDTPTSRITVERTAPGAPGISANFHDKDEQEATLHLSRAEAMQLRDGITRVLVGREGAVDTLGGLLSHKVGFDVTMNGHIQHNAQALMNMARLAVSGEPKRSNDGQGEDAAAVKLAIAALITRRESGAPNKRDDDWRLLLWCAFSTLMFSATEHASGRPECSESMAFERRVKEFLDLVEGRINECRGLLARPDKEVAHG